jgi:hypothetical protein
MADKNWSFADGASFSIMEEEQLTAALTHDRHFAHAGFHTLLRQANIVSRACTKITRSPLMSVRRHLRMRKKRPEGRLLQTAKSGGEPLRSNFGDLTML